MSNALPPLPVLAAPTLVDAGVRGLVENANRLGVSWSLIPGTVTDGANLLANKVVCDGDTEPVGALSMLGYALAPGQRVYIIRTPPSGMYIAGLIGPAIGGLPGQLVAWNYETTNTATFTTTPTVIGTVTAYIIPGFTYRLACNAQLVSTGVDIYQATLYVGNFAATNELQAGRSPSQTSDQARPNFIPLEALYRSAIGGPTQFFVTGHRISGTGNVRRSAGTTFPQYFRVYVDLPGLSDPTP